MWVWSRSLIPLGFLSTGSGHSQRNEEFPDPDLPIPNNAHLHSLSPNFYGNNNKLFMEGEKENSCSGKNLQKVGLLWGFFLIPWDFQGFSPLNSLFNLHINIFFLFPERNFSIFFFFFWRGTSQKLIFPNLPGQTLESAEQISLSSFRGSQFPPLFGMPELELFPPAEELPIPDPSCAFPNSTAPESRPNP